MLNGTRPADVAPIFATTAERREAARAAWRDSLVTGQPLTGRALGTMFDRSDRWGNDRIVEARLEMQRQGDGSLAVQGQDGEMGAGGDEGPACPRSAVDHVEEVGGEVPGWVGIVTTLAVLAVAGAAARASFDHLHALATMAGESDGAWLLPVSVDGLLVTASMVLYRAHKVHQSPGAVPWVALGVGVMGSVAGNIVAVSPDLVDLQAIRIAVAACPPLALALAFEMALRQVR